MLLNNLAQQFVVYFDYNFFYPSVEETWLPIIKRMGLPYLNLEDFLNSQLQTINFAGFNETNPEQQTGLYKIKKRTGLELDQLMDKTLSLTVKLTESYISYFLIRQQMEEFLQMVDVHELYWPPITVSLLDDGGFETISYKYYEITPTSLSELNLSYAARVGTYNTFSIGLNYNYFDIWYRDTNGKMIEVSTTKQTNIVPKTNTILKNNSINNNKNLTARNLASAKLSAKLNINKK